MLRLNISRLLMLPLLGLATAPGFAATNYCIASGGGFGNGGTTYIGTGFAIPAAGICTPWSGFAKTASTVQLTSTGTGCVSSDGQVLTVSIMNTDPPFLGSGNVQSDYIRLTRSGTTGAFTAGTDTGNFGGNALPTTCTSSLLHSAHNHD